jgi:aldose 1-epimerase
MATTDISSSSRSLHGEIDGKPAHLFTLVNVNGMSVQVSELGAHLISVQFPNADGTLTELTLGHATFDGWCNNSASYLGASVGRFGNRIAHGEFTLDGQQFTLATNNDPGGIPCHLHGGPEGVHTKIWHGELLEDAGRQGVKFSHRSPDGDEGYPGNLELSVTYWLNDSNELSWNAEATTDQATPVNIINHTYWNLSGNPDTTITDHEIQILADQFLPTNVGMIPSGEIRNVKGTPMDFTSSKLIGNGIDTSYQPIQTGAGYDHCWVLRKNATAEAQLAAVVKHPASNRTLEVFTNQPGVQFYTGNFLDGSANGRDGHSFPRRSGLCLETQKFPDAPNHPNFPTCILRPGETYRHELIFRLR